MIDFTLINFCWFSMVSLFLNVVRIRFCTENPLSHPAVCTLEVKANLARTLKLGNSGWNLAIRCHSFHIWSLGYCSATTVLFRRLHSWMVVSASINGSDVFCSCFFYAHLFPYRLVGWLVSVVWASSPFLVGSSMLPFDKNPVCVNVFWRLSTFYL